MFIILNLKIVCVGQGTLEHFERLAHDLRSDSIPGQNDYPIGTHVEILFSKLSYLPQSSLSKIEGTSTFNLVEIIFVSDLTALKCYFQAIDLR